MPAWMEYALFAESVVVTLCLVGVSGRLVELAQTGAKVARQLERIADLARKSSSTR